jgi:SAM-dependent methyltransferase
MRRRQPGLPLQLCGGAGVQDQRQMTDNIDRRTVSSFGEEWSRFTQSERELTAGDRQSMFDAYFRIFPWHRLAADSVGADIGCGSGRWAALVAPRVGYLYVADPSAKALAVAEANLRRFANVSAIEAGADNLPFAEGTLDFAYCLGVLHAVPQPAAALRAIVRTLKPGAPLLVYFHYSLDNRSVSYRLLWRVANSGRLFVSRLPTRYQRTACDLIALTVYWPLARGAALLDRLGRLPRNWPLAYYRHRSSYVMRTDAYDRFCTPLERRFSRHQIEQMLRDAGCDDIRFSSEMPFWCAVAIKNSR